MRKNKNIQFAGRMDLVLFQNLATWLDGESDTVLVIPKSLKV